MAEHDDTPSPARTGPRTGGRSTRFRPGQSGNPHGRPQGSRNKASIALEELMAGEGAAITKRVCAAALKGDMQAARIILDRICPRRERTITIALPPIKTAGDAVQALGVVIAATASGEVTPSEASDISSLIGVFIKTLEVTEFEARLAALETRLSQ